MNDITGMCAGACDCVDFCCSFVDPMEDCVHLMSRESQVIMEKCERHTGHSWHQNGECLRCKREGRALDSPATESSA